MPDDPIRYSIVRPLGHEPILMRLERMVAPAGNATGACGTALPHAIVMAGPDGVGKLAAATWWAALLKCERDRPRTTGARCDCPSCVQITVGAHPDVAMIAPPAPGKVIRIKEEVRESLIPFMSLRPVRRGPRMAIVRDADLLTIPAQNAMLKLLEEPPGFGVIVLVTASPAALLPTIRSRCQTIRFGPLPEEALETLLRERGMDARLARAASVLGRGSLGRALACDGEVLEDRVALIAAFESFRAGDGPAMEDLVSDLAERRKSERSELPVLLEWQLKKIEAAYGCHAEVESDTLAPLLSRAAGEAPERLIEEAAHTETAMRRVERHANTKLALRELLLHIRPS